MGRPPSIQWNVKQWLGDNKVLAMDWDARAMHFHLLMLSIQENPPGSLPDDTDAIRRWLGLPSGSVDSDQTWRRVRPQIFAAWSIREGRWFNSGMEDTFEKKANYASRPQNGSTSVPYQSQNPPINVLDVSLGLDLSTSKPKESTKAKSKFYLPDWIPKETWQAYEEMRRKIRKPMTDKARELAIKDLGVLKSQGNPTKAVLEQSVMNSWQGLFPLKVKVVSNGKHDNLMAAADGAFDQGDTQASADFD